jgi:hypothetical protein
MEEKNITKSDEEPPPISDYFFQQHWESEYIFLEKNITPFKLNGRSLIHIAETSFNHP